MARRPYVNPLVPTRSIDRYLGRIHVRTPFAVVEAELREAPGLRSDPRWTPRLVDQSIRYARWRHAQNLAEALAVGLR